MKQKIAILMLVLMSLCLFACKKTNNDKQIKDDENVDGYLEVMYEPALNLNELEELDDDELIIELAECGYKKFRGEGKFVYYAKYLGNYPVADLVLLLYDQDNKIKKIYKYGQELNLDNVYASDYDIYFNKPKEVDHPDYDDEVLTYCYDFLGVYNGTLIPIRYYNYTVPVIEGFLIAYYNLKDEKFIKFSEGYKLLMGEERIGALDDEALAEYDSRIESIVQYYINKEK